MRWLKDLNEAQRAAVEARDGPVLIIAGPGTGKTKTLTTRIAYLLSERHVRPDKILALTFTKKAAEEMQQRVTLLTATDKQHVPGVRIATFHALCHELLGGDIQFITEPARLQLIRGLSKPAALKGLTVRELGLLISRAKNMALDDAAVSRIVHSYDVALAEQGLLDFDDLLVRTRDMLAQDPLRRQEIQDRFTHILVDEFQDTNRLQYALLQAIRGHTNVFAIGDPNQSIYGFRGASGDIFGQFRKDFPDHLAITLTTNYRSAPEIVALSNTIFGDTPLASATSHMGQVRAVEVLNEYGEADWVLREIQRGIGGGDFSRVVSDDDRSAHRTLADFAVLYRSRNAAAAFQKAVDHSGLPYQVVGDGSPYDATQVQIVIALLKAAAAGDHVALEGFTAAECRQLDTLIAETDSTPPTVLAEKVITALGFPMDRQLNQLLGVLVRFESVAAAARYFDALASQQFYDPGADAITLLTIHAAKGLEFPVVFLLGAEEDMLPSKRGDVAEERRLFYVAVTRARERLEITYAKSRGGNPSQPSRFMKNIAAHILPQIRDPEMQTQARRIAKRAAKRSQQSLF
jgi:DNA helicase II / ATP-dependent DNA helicase PcrA